MEKSFRFTASGPLTFHGDNTALRRAIELTRRLSKVRKCHYRLSEQGAPKPILDLLMRTRLRLEAMNTWHKASSWRA